MYYSQCLISVFKIFFPLFGKKNKDLVWLKFKFQSNVYFSSKATMHVKWNSICSHSFALHFLINLNLHSQGGHVIFDRHGWPFHTEIPFFSKVLSKRKTKNQFRATLFHQFKFLCDLCDLFPTKNWSSIRMEQFHVVKAPPLVCVCSLYQNNNLSTWSPSSILRQNGSNFLLSCLT